MTRRSLKTKTIDIEVPVNPEAPAEGDPNAPKTPTQWAIAKGIVVVRGGRIDYRAGKPHLLKCAYILKKWPDPKLDPTYTLSEADFDQAVKEVS